MLAKFIAFNLSKDLSKVVIVGVEELD